MNKDFKQLNKKIEESLTFDGPVLCNDKIKKGEQIIPKLVFGKTLENLGNIC